MSGPWRFIPALQHRARHVPGRPGIRQHRLSHRGWRVGLAGGGALRSDPGCRRILHGTSTAGRPACGRRNDADPDRRNGRLPGDDHHPAPRGHHADHSRRRLPVRAAVHGVDGRRRGTGAVVNRIPVFRPTVRRDEMDSVLGCLVTDAIGPGNVRASLPHRWLPLWGWPAVSRWPTTARRFVRARHDRVAEWRARAVLGAGTAGASRRHRGERPGAAGGGCQCRIRRGWTWIWRRRLAPWRRRR